MKESHKQLVSKDIKSQSLISQSYSLIQSETSSRQLRSSIKTHPSHATSLTEYSSGKCIFQVMTWHFKNADWISFDSYHFNMWDISQSTQVKWNNHSDKQSCFNFTCSWWLQHTDTELSIRETCMWMITDNECRWATSHGISFSKLWPEKFALLRFKYRFGCIQSMPFCMENDGLAIDRNIFCISGRNRGNTLHWFLSSIWMHQAWH